MWTEARFSGRFGFGSLVRMRIPVWAHRFDRGHGAQVTGEAGDASGHVRGAGVGEQHVAGGEFDAVVELDPLAQGELPGQRVDRPPTRGQTRLQRVVVVVHQEIEEEHVDRAVAGVVVQLRVERGDWVGEGDPERAVLRQHGRGEQEQGEEGTEQMTHGRQPTSAALPRPGHRVAGIAPRCAGNVPRVEDRSMATYRLAARITAVVSAVALALPAQAQFAPTDPPARVGRLASITGTVSYHLPDADRWEAATVNLPLTSGSAVWTEPASRAVIGVGGNQITLDASTEFDLDRLDDHVLVATEPQGASYLHLRIVPNGDSYTVQTPRGIVGIAAVGRYEVVAGDLEHPTTVTVIEGAAEVSGLPTPVAVAANQTLTITGDGTTTPFTPALGPAVRDAFLTAMLEAERARPARPANLSPYVEQMTGVDALYEYGNWAETPEYGEVWYPPAEQGFVPYRDGHWAYVQPWGWTWVDNAPWGFAPTHYGRWAEIGGRWGWIPGAARVRDERPVYAPAVVGFLAGAAAGSLVSWAPLGPREPYRPPYRTSERYLQAVNRANVPDPAALRGRPFQLANRAAATSVPPQVLVQSQNVRPAVQTLPPQAVQRPAPVQFRPPVAPTAATVGVTNRVAQQLRLPPAEAPPRPAAPGPSLAPGGARPGARVPVNLPAPGQVPPALAPSGTPSAATPGPGAIGGAAAGAAAGIVAGGLLRQGPSSPAALPQLRPQGSGRTPGQPGAPGPAIARPGAPALPPLSPAGGQAAPGPAGAPASPGAIPPRPGAPGAPVAAPATPGVTAPGAVAPPPGAAPRPGTTVAAPPAPGAGSPAPAAAAAPAHPGAPGAPVAAPATPGGPAPGAAAPAPGAAPRPGPAVATPPAPGVAAPAPLPGAAPAHPGAPGAPAAAPSTARVPPPGAVAPPPGAAPRPGPMVATPPAPGVAAPAPLPGAAPARPGAPPAAPPMPGAVPPGSIGPAAGAARPAAPAPPPPTAPARPQPPAAPAPAAAAPPARIAPPQPAPPPPAAHVAPPPALPQARPAPPPAPQRAAPFVPPPQARPAPPPPPPQVHVAPPPPPQVRAAPPPPPPQVHMGGRRRPHRRRRGRFQPRHRRPPDRRRRGAGARTTRTIPKFRRDRVTMQG